jgi:hypothetical protein
VNNVVLEKVNRQMHDTLKQMMKDKNHQKIKNMKIFHDDNQIFATEIKDRPTDKTHE